MPKVRLHIYHGLVKEGMEILLTETIDIERVADLCAVGLKRKLPEPRDYSAWHVSNLLYSAQAIAKGDNSYREYEGRPSGIMSMGRVWEAAVDCYLAAWAVERGGAYLPDVTQAQDEIVGSLDGLLVLDTPARYLPRSPCIVVSETKLRFTLNSEIPLAHLQQMRAYCYLVNTDLVCYVSGHLSSAPPTAQATLRLIRMTRQSIEETWQMIVNTRDYLLGIGCVPKESR